MFALDSKKKRIDGTLMSIEEDPSSRYRFEIWFDYTREIMNTISEGAMVAVPNYFLDSRDPKHQWSSVLEITTLLPVHYAIGQNQNGFPGFLQEAARSAAQDWVDQESESTDDTTKIRCVAIPTNLMLDDKGTLQDEQGLPMVGHKASLLNTETTEVIANLGIDIKKDDVVRVGPLIRDHEVNVYVRVEEALRTHYAVFGFTGAGKSNLLSTLVSTVLKRGAEKPPVKIVFFDLMGEFSILLMDQLVELPHAGLLAIHPETLPESVLNYYAATTPAAKKPLLDRAAADLARTSLFPKRLKEKQPAFKKAIEQLLEANKIRVWQPQDRTIGRYVAEHRDEFDKGNMGGSAQTVRDHLDSAERNNDGFTAQSVDAAVGNIPRTNADGSALTSTANINLRLLERRLREELANVGNRVNAPQICRSYIPKIVEQLNSDKEPSLIVVQAADPDELRRFASYLGDAIYESRRRSGSISPLVSFVFDEADEFIPLNAERDTTYAQSTAVAMSLARRGRKFGLGIAIATQRVTYLNTSIMAQPHTYFISKLPRKSDRDRVCEAFGISEDMFRQTFKFRKGNWLLVSHDATGLDAVPLPIQTMNADERLLNWIKEKGY